MNSSLNTTLLLIRHAESDVRSGPDRERGLTAKGREDAVLPGGESFREAQARGLRAVHRLLGAHRGGTVAAGTHGNLLAMILRAYDARFDFAFWERLAMPDVYRLDFEHDELRGVERL